ncbi:hypothetical protein ACPPVO_44240 [Dactylosporangium sp. McL0621]|uniref:hypothetical protein n=1 Tax=Dactylosporangium sp. McL0621 TaxID=3415678 RepID=UPI003CE6DF67
MSRDTHVHVAVLADGAAGSLPREHRVRPVEDGHKLDRPAGPTAGSAARAKVAGLIAARRPMSTLSPFAAQCSPAGASRLPLRRRSPHSAPGEGGEQHRIVCGGPRRPHAATTGRTPIVAGTAHFRPSGTARLSVMVIGPRRVPGRDRLGRGPRSVAVHGD